MRWRSAEFLLFAVVALLLSGGCALLPELDERSPYFKVPKGSVIDLNERIRIPPAYARVWIQNGVQVGTRFDAFSPSCGVEIARIDRERPQYVEPGRFRVVKVQFLREEVVQARPARVASAGGDSSDGTEWQDLGAPLYHEGYHLWVKNPDQPNVRRFTCRGVYDSPSDAKPPSVQEIRAVLAPVATLLLPDELGEQ